MKTSKCVKLFLTFLKIGAFTFGGGYAMLPLIKREIVEEKGWLDSQEMFDIVAVAESTPGPLAVNAATFVGRRVAGFKGALCATAGVVLPSFLLILAVSNVLTLVEQLEVVRYAFNGIRAGVLVLIFSALISLFCQMEKNWFSYGLLAIALLLVLLFHVNTIVVLIVCTAAGCLYKSFAGGGEKE